MVQAHSLRRQSQEFALPSGVLNRPELQAEAVVFSGDRSVHLDSFDLKQPSADDLVIDTEMTGISAGTEKLFWSGDMPPFPGMGYPLVPGYETVGRVVWAEAGSPLIGRRVFIPGSHCFEGARCLFGGAASRLVVNKDRVRIVDDLEPDEALMLSLAATAYHAVAINGPPDLIVGFGALGRLIYRVSQALGYPEPIVWETNPVRAKAEGIAATTAEESVGLNFQCVYDASGNECLVDRLIEALKPSGVLVLAGFYAERIGFNFAPAFLKEACIRIAAEWTPSDMNAVTTLVADGRLSLKNLVTHSMPWPHAAAAYDTAFNDPDCLKMTLDWRSTYD